MFGRDVRGIFSVTGKHNWVMKSRPISPEGAKGRKSTRRGPRSRSRRKDADLHHADISKEKIERQVSLHRGDIRKEGAKKEDDGKHLRPSFPASKKPIEPRMESNSQQKINKKKKRATKQQKRKRFRPPTLIRPAKERKNSEELRKRKTTW